LLESSSSSSSSSSSFEVVSVSSSSSSFEVVSVSLVPFELLVSRARTCAPFRTARTVGLAPEVWVREERRRRSRWVRRAGAASLARHSSHEKQLSRHDALTLSYLLHSACGDGRGGERREERGRREGEESECRCQHGVGVGRCNGWLLLAVLLVT